MGCVTVTLMYFMLTIKRIELVFGVKATTEDSSFVLDGAPNPPAEGSLACSESLCP